MCQIYIKRCLAQKGIDEEWDYDRFVDSMVNEGTYVVRLRFIVSVNELGPPRAEPDYIWTTSVNFQVGINTLELAQELAPYSIPNCPDLSVRVCCDYAYLYIINIIIMSSWLTSSIHHVMILYYSQQMIGGKSQ